MSRCGCGSSCSCAIEAGTNVTVAGTGSSASHYIVSSVGSGPAPDFFSFLISANDGDTFSLINAYTVGYTSLALFDKVFGAEVLNEALVTLGVGNSFQFIIVAGQITVDYDLGVRLFVSSPDCTEKLLASVTVPVTVADAFGLVTFPDAADWDVILLGTDLSLDNGGKGEPVIVTDAGGCYMAQISAQWQPT